MPANFPSAQNNLPGSYVNPRTAAVGVAGLGTARVAILMGEGSRNETIVSSAVGSGRDGWNPTFTSTLSGTTGRHFRLQNYPVISNRTKLYRRSSVNGAETELLGLEQAFNSNSGSFSSRYNYRLNIEEGTIELQGASLVDQGGAFYRAAQLNVGNGTVNALELIDSNAPSETWTLRCTSVRRDGYGDPIDGYGIFIAQGSVSGILRDGYGNVITWSTDGTINDNGILSFGIADGVTPFSEGDRFTVQVQGGALSAGEGLRAEYIAELDLNDPDLFTDANSLYAKHGSPSLENRLSLGAQLLFQNGAQAVYTCQCAPAIPRRVSYVVETSASGGTTEDDLTFPLNLGVIPDGDSSIKFFVTDALTQVESQVLPNKVDFYDPTYTANPSQFFTDNTYAYTVILQDSVVSSAIDGELVSIGPTSATLESNSVTFTSNDVGRNVRLLEPSVNAGLYTIASVTNGIATISDGVTSFTDEADVRFEVVDDTDQSAVLLITPDLALSAGNSLRVGIVDVKDADFFDVNWTAAFEAIESIDVDMVVPLPSQTISSIFAAAKAHCLAMSDVNNAKERALLIGAIAGLNPENLTGEEDAAVEDIGILEGIQGDDPSEILAGNIEDLASYSVPDAFGDTFRVQYYWPDEILVQVGDERLTVDGMFLAAAGAGWFSGSANIAMPQTRKTLAGFSIPRSKQRYYRPSILNNLAAAGVTIVEPVVGGGRVLWGKSTVANNNPVEEEMSVVFIRDRIARALRATFLQFVGQPTNESTIASMKTAAEKAAQSFKASRIITAYRNVSVVQDSVESRQFNVAMEVVPTNAVNWIYIEPVFAAI